MSLLHGFENYSVQVKRSSPFIWRENASIQTKNCVAALSMMAFIVIGSLVRQVLLPYYIELDTWELLQVLVGRTKCSGGPQFAHLCSRSLFNVVRAFFHRSSSIIFRRVFCL